MKKIFTAIATIIVTRFIIKMVDRIKNPPMPTREELHEEMLRKKRAYEERRFAPKVNGARFKENIPEPKEPCDGAALRPCSDMGLRAWGGECNGSAMGIAR